MGHYYKNRRYGRGYAQKHVSARKSLSRAVGGIDEDISAYFLAMTGPDLESLFLEYGLKYGAKPEQYARQTFASWKSGSVRMSGQTAQRLLELLPPRLPNRFRIELIRKLRSYYFRKERISVQTTPELWKDDLLGPIQRLVASSTSFTLPDIVAEKATWQTDGASVAAQRLLAAAEQEEAAVRIAFLDREFNKIGHMMADIDTHRKLNHVIELPQGSVSLSVELKARTLLQRLKDFCTA